MPKHISLWSCGLWKELLSLVSPFRILPGGIVATPRKTLERVRRHNVTCSVIFVHENDENPSLNKTFWSFGNTFGCFSKIAVRYPKKNHGFPSETWSICYMIWGVSNKNHQTVFRCSSELASWDCVFPWRVSTHWTAQDLKVLPKSMSRWNVDLMNWGPN